MRLVKTICSNCGREYLRTAARMNEAKKSNWRNFCSKECLSKSRRTGKYLKCGVCDKIFYRPVNEIKNRKNHFCSSSCAAKMNNKERARNRPVRLCANPLCRKPLPPGERNAYCSPLHRINKRKIPDAEYRNIIISRIKNFYNLYKRIPLKREMQGAYKTARVLFGTWNKAIKAAGFSPNPIMFAKKYIAKDGHKCDSMAEKIIDDYLYLNKIAHERGVPYPQNKCLTADFKIENKLVEFFGLAGQIKEYDRLAERKRLICRKYNVPLIEIYPKDISPISRLNKIF
jgi:hypothetical protein